MSEKNSKNRLDLALAHNNDRLGRPDAELARLSAGQNVRMERVVATPNYSDWTRTISSADANPNTTPPPSGLWDFAGYMGIHGYLVFTGGTSPTATVELWAYDSTNNMYYLSDSAVVGDKEEFRFSEGARGRKVFLRVLNLSAGVTSIAMRATPE